MSLIIPANTLSSGGFAVDNSCRFDDGSSTQMYKTISSTSTTWTFSCWIKLNPTGTNQYLASWDMGGGESLGIGIEASTNQLFIYTTSTGQSPKLYDGKLRDPSAWMNIVIKNSSGTITSYINGTQAKTSITGTALASGTLRIGCWTGSNYFFDGYMSEVVLIDGTAYNADSFGEFDSDSNIWKPINVSGLTFGTDGFYLDFEDSANLGNDANGGTDLTEANLTAIDQSTDTCTNNFCTMNPLDQNGGIVFSDGNLSTASTSASWRSTRGTFGMTQGKWYFEVKVANVGGALLDMAVGISDFEIAIPAEFSSSNPALTYTAGSGNKQLNGVNSAYGATYNINDIVGVAFDADALTVEFYKNGVSQGVITTSWSAGVTWSPVISLYGRYSNTKASFNFGSPSFAISSGNTDGNGYGNFEYAVPSGYYSLCTKNLSEFG
jgi:hypothetical protein